MKMRRVVGVTYNQASLPPCTLTTYRDPKHSVNYGNTICFAKVYLYVL